MKKYFIAFFAFITLFACGTSLPPEQEFHNFITWTEKFADETMAEPVREFVTLVRKYERKPAERKVIVQDLQRIMNEMEKLVKEMPGMPDVSHSDIKELKKTYITTSEEQIKLFKQIVETLDQAQNVNQDKWKEVEDHIEWLEDQIQLRERELDRHEKRLKQKYSK